MQKPLQIRRIARTFALACIGLFASAQAQAIVLGSQSSLGRHMVRIVGPAGVLNCSGTVIDRLHVATAAHCGPRAVDIGGKRFAILQRLQTATLADGRVVSVQGDALILQLREPLPATSLPIEIGTQGTDGDFRIAGYGATKEALRGKLGALHEAPVVVLRPFRLVAPDRMSDFTASACFGDSGGAVLRNGALVGIITRASHPERGFSCGHLTHYVPITTAPFAAPPSPNGTNVSAAAPVPPRRVMYRRGFTSR